MWNRERPPYFKCSACILSLPCLCWPFDIHSYSGLNIFIGFQKIPQILRYYKITDITRLRCRFSSSELGECGATFHRALVRDVLWQCHYSFSLCMCHMHVFGRFWNFVLIPYIRREIYWSKTSRSFLIQPRSSFFQTFCVLPYFAGPIWLQMGVDFLDRCATMSSLYTLGYVRVQYFNLLFNTWIIWTWHRFLTYRSHSTGKRTAYVLQSSFMRLASWTCLWESRQRVADGHRFFPCTSRRFLPSLTITSQAGRLY